MSHTVVWTELALTRVSELSDFLAERNPAVARRMVDRLFDRVAELAEHPRLGPPLASTAEPDLRLLVVDDYVIAYRVLDDQDTVAILTVRHGRERRQPPEEG